MKILLTGKTGQIGRDLELALQHIQGVSMQVVAPNRTQLDLADLQQVRELIRNTRPNLIVNAAAYTAVDLAETQVELATRINADAVAVIAKEAHRCNAALIHYSTDYVFDGGKHGAYLEEDDAKPVNVYGHTKLAGEAAVIASGVSHVILRTSWVYSAHRKNFLRAMQALAGNRDELKVVADQYGAPTWSRTIALKTRQMIARLCGFLPEFQHDGQHQCVPKIIPEKWQQLGGLYHVTAQGYTSWHGWASAIVANGPYANRVTVAPISSKDYPSVASRPKNSRLDCDRFIRTFGALPDWQADLNICLKEIG